jgi:hypothetical protein
MSTLPSKTSWEFAEAAINQQCDHIDRTWREVFQIVNFLRNWDSDNTLIAYLEKQLEGMTGRTMAVRNHAERLAQLADPDNEELPF